MSLPSLTVVTPWYGHLELAKDYWRAMHAVDAHVLVIDNGSHPPLPNGWRLDTNRGFSHACNVGLQRASTDAVLFLNNDVAMVAPDWLTPIREALEPGVLVGAQLRTDVHGDVDGHRLPYLDGWCLAGMREDLLALGGFDESFEEPAYFGDNDLCLRARAEGIALREVRVGLRHLTNSTSDDDQAARAAASTANRARFQARARDILGVTA